MYLNTNQTIPVPQNFTAPENPVEKVQTKFGVVRVEKIHAGFWQVEFCGNYEYGKTRDEALDAITRTAGNLHNINWENY